MLYTGQKLSVEIEFTGSILPDGSQSNIPDSNTSAAGCWLLLLAPKLALRADTHFYALMFP